MVEVSSARASLAMVVILFTGLLFLTLAFLPEPAGATTLYVGGGGPGNYTTIQAAEFDANPGDSIFVYSGVYIENVVIHKALSLIGENSSTTVVEANLTQDAIRVIADWVNISGFTVTGTMNLNDGAIHLYGANNCTVSGNNLTGNRAGVFAELSNDNNISSNVVSSSKFGVYLSNSNSNKIADNTIHSIESYGIGIRDSEYNDVIDNDISNCSHGVNLWSSRENNIRNNSAFDNRYGIYTTSSGRNAISENTVLNGTGGIRISSYGSTVLNNIISFNDLFGIMLFTMEGAVVENNLMLENGIGIEGGFLHWNTHTIPVSNTVNGKPVYYWKNVSGGVIPSGAGQVILANCSEIVIENQNLSNASFGAQIGYSPNSTISNNTMSGNKNQGIYVTNSDNSTITNNTILGGDDGILVEYSNRVILIRNEIGNSGFGLTLAASNNSTAADNSISFSSVGGLNLGLCKNNTIFNNTVSWSEHGIQISDSEGNTLENNTATANKYHGIRVYNSNANIIVGNNLSNNEWGLVVYWSANNTILDNSMSGNGNGTWSLDSVNNSFIQNNISHNDWAGMLVESSWLMRIMRNNISSNAWYGIWFSWVADSEIENSTVRENYDGIRLYNSSYNTVSDTVISDNGGVGLGLTLSSDNSFLRNTIRSNNNGVYANDSSSRNEFQGNEIANNTMDGIVMQNDCKHNTVVGNNITANSGYGLALLSCSNTDIHWNNFINNSVQAFDDRPNFPWNAPYPIGGNYWSDYTGSDLFSGPDQNQPGSDGLGDTPYVIDADTQDKYPLMSPFERAYPRPPVVMQAFLTGDNLENVTILWLLSSDDGAGLESVVEYRIYRGMTYDSVGSGYELIATLPNGTSMFVDSLSGEGSPNFFYSICSVDMDNRTACSEEQAGKFTRPLNDGLNLVSIPAIQSNNSVEAVLQTVNFDKAWYYDTFSQEWMSYMRFKPYSALRLGHRMGIWVNVTETSNLTVAGVVPTQTLIQLRAGWNLVGFPSFNTTYTVADLKAETGAMRVEGYDPSVPPYFLRVLADGETLQAGYGYWVRVESDITWIVSA